VAATLGKKDDVKEQGKRITLLTGLVGILKQTDAKEHRRRGLGLMPFKMMFVYRAPSAPEEHFKK